MPNEMLARSKASLGKDLGLVFQSLHVNGFGDPTDLQRTFSGYPLMLCTRLLMKMFRKSEASKVCILNDFEGHVSKGELLLVLGKPGSGCTTLLKTLAGDTHGLRVHPEALVSYEGMS